MLITTAQAEEEFTVTETTGNAHPRQAHMHSFIGLHNYIPRLYYPLFRKVKLSLEVSQLGMLINADFLFLHSLASPQFPEGT